MRTACDLCLNRKRKCVPNGRGSCLMCSARQKLCTFTPAHIMKKRQRGCDPDFTSSIRRYSPSLGYTTTEPESEVDSIVSYSPVIRSPFGPSPITGFIGLVENDYLQTFLKANVGMTFCNHSDLQRAVATRVSCITSPSSAERRIGSLNADFDDAMISATSKSALLISLASGATLQQRVDPTIVLVYLHEANLSMVDFNDIPTPQVLRVHLLMSEIYAFLQDYSKFNTSINLASRIARKIAEAHSMAIEQGKKHPPPMLDEGLWFQLEGLQFLQKLVCAEISTKVDQGCEDIIQQAFCLNDAKDKQDTAVGKNEYTIPQLIVSGYMPCIEGLPTFHPDAVQRLMERSSLMPRNKCRQLARHNVVASVLTELAQPDIHSTALLANVVTKGKTCMLPVTLALDQCTAQLMNMVVANKDIGIGSQTRGAAEKVSLIMERLFEYLTNDYLRHPGLNQLCLVSNAAFLRLYLGDEKGCLRLLLMLFHMIVAGPGLMRFPFWCHTIHWITALLFSAGQYGEHDEIVRLYNSFDFCNEVNRMPTDFRQKVSLFQCSQYQCLGIRHVLENNLSTGQAKIFVNHLLLTGKGGSPVTDSNRICQLSLCKVMEGREPCSAAMTQANLQSMTMHRALLSENAFITPPSRNREIIEGADMPIQSPVGRHYLLVDVSTSTPSYDTHCVTTDCSVTNPLALHAPISLAKSEDDFEDDIFLQILSELSKE